MYDNIRIIKIIKSTVILTLNEGETIVKIAITVEDIIYPRARIDIEKID